jgi:hypothetical protein
VILVIAHNEDEPPKVEEIKKGQTGLKGGHGIEHSLPIRLSENVA